MSTKGLQAESPVQNAVVRQLRILLVEDHDFTRSMVAAALRVEGCLVVASVPSARDAMQAVQQHTVDCAIIDLNLGPGPSGLDLAYGLRDFSPEIGILLLTSYRDPRLHSADERPLPPGAHSAVKDDVRSTTQLREAINIAMGDTAMPSLRGIASVPLTNTQMEILRMVADGLSNAQIAKRRGVTERSVQTALWRILANLPVEAAPDTSVRVQLVKAYQMLTGGSGAG